jgi:type IV secretory pathway VirJ component
VTRPLLASLVAVSLAAASLPALASHPQASPKSKPKAKPSPPPAGVTEETKKLPGFGDVTIDRPKDLAKARGVVLFVSGDGGWNLGVVDMARRLADRAIVAGLSMPAWQKRAEASPNSCWYPSGELEVAAQALEKSYGLPRYVRPILVGYSSGATVVYGALAQAPPTTFRGAVSLGFCPDLEVRRPFCGSKSWKPGWDEKKHQSWLPEWTAMPEREGGGDKWIALQGLIDQVCEPQATVDFVNKVPHSKIVSLDKVGHGFSVPARWGAAFDKSVVEMLEPGSVMDAQPATVHQSETDRSPVEVTAKLEGLDLPLEIVWPETARAVVVFVSGDGGWAELDGQVAKGLAAKGIAVVGWNTLRYFWLEKTPDRFAKDLSRLIGALPEGLPVFAGGYSFGAETIPVVVAASAKTFPALAGLAGLVLLGPGPYAAFEVSPLDWFREGGGSTAHPVAKAVASLGPLAVLCMDSRGTSDSGCPEDPRPGYEKVELPGGHHFGGDYDDIAARIATFVQANSAR